ncbi:MAG: hypothetical protein L3J39_15490 [Verrucomicrobiales bacterium]|nr:hypothetical protein [Verrucomicrobiales bacterium]
MKRRFSFFQGTIIGFLGGVIICFLISILATNFLKRYATDAIVIQEGVSLIDYSHRKPSVPETEVVELKFIGEVSLDISGEEYTFLKFTFTNLSAKLITLELSGWVDPSRIPVATNLNFYLKTDRQLWELIYINDSSGEGVSIAPKDSREILVPAFFVENVRNAELDLIVAIDGYKSEPFTLED